MLPIPVGERQGVAKRFMLSDIVILLGIFIIIFFMVAGLFVSDQSVVSAMEREGFSYVRIIDKQWLAVSVRGCWGYAARLRTWAVSPEQKEEEVIVCVGWPYSFAEISERKIVNTRISVP